MQVRRRSAKRSTIAVPHPHDWRTTRLHELVRPFMLRRRKSDVETDLPHRTDRTFFVELSREQRNRDFEHDQAVARLVAIAIMDNQKFDHA